MSSITIPTSVFKMMAEGLDPKVKKEIHDELKRVRDEADVILLAMDVKFTPMPDEDKE